MKVVKMTSAVLVFLLSCSSCSRRLASTEASDRHVQEGERLWEEGSWDAAIEEYALAAKVSPNSAKPRIKLRSAQLTCGRFDEARAQFQEALRLDPSSASARFHLACVLDLEGSLDTSLSHYREYLKVRPSDARAAQRVVDILCYKGRYTEAFNELQALKARGSASLWIDMRITAIYQAQGKWDELTTHLKKVVNRRPDCLPVHLCLAWVLAHRRLFPDAYPLALRALDIDPNNAYAHCLAGYVLDGLGQPDKAREHYERAVSIDPSSSYARDRLDRPGHMKAAPPPSY